MSLFHNPENSLKCNFSDGYSSTIYYEGIQILFSGQNAASFYRLVKQNKIDLTVFEKVNLVRIDLCYTREILEDDSDHCQIRDYLEKSFQKVQETGKWVSLDWSVKPTSAKSKIFRVGRRGNSQVFRIYVRDEFIRYETKFQKRQTRLVQDLFLNLQFTEFEQKLIQKYYKMVSRSVELNNPYSDWLVKSLRVQPSQKQQKFEDGVQTTYLDIDILNQWKNSQYTFQM